MIGSKPPEHFKGKVTEIRNYLKDGKRINTMQPIDKSESPKFFAQYVIAMQQIDPRTGQDMGTQQLPGEVEITEVKTIDEAFDKHEETVKEGSQKQAKAIQDQMMKADLMAGRLGGGIKNIKDLRGNRFGDNHK
jgi:hypothetical protein